MSLLSISTSLTSLNLSNNGLGVAWESGAAMAAALVRSNVSLCALILDGNSFSGRSHRALLQACRDCSKLNTLSLRGQGGTSAEFTRLDVEDPT